MSFKICCKNVEKMMCTNHFSKKKKKSGNGIAEIGGKKKLLQLVCGIAEIERKKNLWQ